ncbi:MAG: hypothetical protein GY793_07370 [Proteobacteria bacterium]|nr:hypothetical protein [Pseudomonadota bacterium]
MKCRKKIIMPVSLLALLAIAYTSFWFINKADIEENIDIYFTHIADQFSAEDLDYDLNLGCFPFMCVTLKNVRIQTSKNFAASKEGFLFEALIENALEYKTYNIFKPAITIKKQHFAVDSTITNLTINQSIKILFLTDLFDFAIDESNSSLELNNLSVQLTAQNSPLLPVAEMGYVKAYYNNQKESGQAGVDLGDILLFSPQTGAAPKKIHHLKADFNIQNFPTDEIDLLMQKHLEQNSDIRAPENVAEIVKTFANKQTKITVKDFKLTDDDLQVFAKSEFSIDTDAFLNADLQTSFKFFAAGSPLEQIMINSNIVPNAKKLYELNISITPRGGFLNGKLIFPAINFTPKQPQLQETVVTPEKLEEKLNLTPKTVKPVAK